MPLQSHLCRPSISYSNGQVLFYLPAFHLVAWVNYTLVRAQRASLAWTDAPFCISHFVVLHGACWSVAQFLLGDCMEHCDNLLSWHSLLTWRSGFFFPHTAFLFHLTTCLNPRWQSLIYLHRLKHMVAYCILPYQFQYSSTANNLNYLFFFKLKTLL